ncbi:nucleotide sugar dehydrogenase [Pseudomonas sp. JV414]|uniref:nucleotide sugar dehydrogenase n=1 Tax=Pseudomonas sp. JV414 TaxID=1733110 RepID=UPI0028E0ACDF|nr:nucleotide sugar dehydrogenase [Pseudomonas sp. JV414]MDT9678144.1 nucleotide sugar dehydrogenase [Pseudomonas sp. JV414]
MNNLRALEEKIKGGAVVVGVYGLGYAGLPLAFCFSEAGIKVIGFDNDEYKVSCLNSGESYIGRIPSAKVASALGKTFEATCDFTRTREVDAIIICVPTPLNQYHEPDISYIVNTVEAIMPYFREGQLLSLESTTWPGTTDEILAVRLQAAGFQPGQNCALVFSPEREDPGNLTFELHNIPKVIGGITPICLSLGKALYGCAFTEMIPVSSTRTAEMSKLLENIHRAVNIGLVNEMKIVTDKMGINIQEVIHAAGTKPFGFVSYMPGPGVGGHCIPVDPFYLTWKARAYGVRTRFIELAGEVNRYMPQWVVQKVISSLNERHKPINGSRILVLGVAYKKNVDDTRESPSIEILSILAKSHAIVHYSDPYVPDFPKKRNYSFDLCSVELSCENIRGYDCVVLATDHDLFDYDFIARHASLIVDTRGRYKQACNVVAA